MRAKLRSYAEEKNRAWKECEKYVDTIPTILRLVIKLLFTNKHSSHEV